MKRFGEDHGCPWGLKIAQKNEFSQSFRKSSAKRASFKYGIIWTSMLPSYRRADTYKFFLLPNLGSYANDTINISMDQSLFIS
jgi:hypothetical protein